MRLYREQLANDGTRCTSTAADLARRLRLERSSRLVTLGLMVSVALWGGAVASSGDRTRPAVGADATKGRAEEDKGAEAKARPTPATEPTAPEEATELNLLGQTDASSGEGRRNENVQFNAVDNNALRELQTRLGTTATIIGEFEPEHGYFGSEFGRPPSKLVHLPARAASGVHGSIHEMHNNSVFTARSFFQAGGVKPARENRYGADFRAPVWRGGYFSIEGSQQRVRGSVNGNILVPRADERTPLDEHPETRTNDPATRAAVVRLLGSFPAELPNRTDIDSRALNTNSPQKIDTDLIGGRIDQHLSDRDRLALRYRLTSQRVDAFQLVAGQNPDTTIQSHTARMSWTRSWSPATVTDFSVGFDRVESLLVPEENAFPMDASFGEVIERIGPGSAIPMDRAENRFTYGARVKQVRGTHSLTAGTELMRRQFNGTEVSSLRGFLGFRNDFGRDALTNLRLGIPTRFSGALGASHQGFRNWDMQYYAGDAWRLHPKFTLSVAVRYTPVPPPIEVDGLSEVGFGCDCNNAGGHFGFAFQLPERWGVLRAGYGLHYAEVYPATYQQVRFNPPAVFKIVVPNPDLVDPLGGLRIEDLDPNQRSTIFVNHPHLVSPYSQQYSFSWETELASHWQLQLGYVGSRSQKLFLKSYTNRAQPVDGIDFTTGTVNERRPDQEHFDVRRIINTSRGYFDAARATLVVPDWRGLTVTASYWFSKAIDLGTGYTDTGAGVTSQTGRNQSEFSIHEDLKGLSTFDQSHAFLWRFQYVTPELSSRRGWLKRAFGGWNFSAVTLLKTGTPFTVLTGSDSPGFGNVDGRPGDRPDIVDPSILGRTIDDPDTSRALLPAAAFSFMTPGEARGNVGQNTFRKDGINNINAAISRTWTVHSDQTVTFRAESINLFNRPQFAEPGNTLSSANFGQITNTLNDGRTFQFLLRFAF